MSERRRWERFLLRIKGRPTFHCTVTVADGPTLACSLQDISCGGVRLGLPKGEELPQLVDGQGVEFESFDAPRFAFMQGKRGMVSWYRPGDREFGVSFTEILRKGQVVDLLDP